MIAPLSRGEARAAVAESVDVTSGAEAGSPPAAILTEYLRVALRWLCASSGGEPVYVSRLLWHVRRQLGPAWLDLSPEVDTRGVGAPNEGARDARPLRRALNDLKYLREAEEVEGGGWLPTPLRLIALPETAHAMVIGGLSTAEAKRTLGADPVRRAGLARIVALEDLSGAILRDPERWQPLKAWRGSTPDDLKCWTKAKLARAGLQPSASEMESFHVYVPARDRWTAVEKLRPTPRGTRLCRAWLPKQKRPHFWIGDLRPEGGRARCVAERPVQRSDAERLVYGLAARAERPPAARWLRDDREETVTLELDHRIPHQERRLLVALAHEVSAQRGKPPLRFEVPRAIAGCVRQELRRLCVDVGAPLKEEPL